MGKRLQFFFAMFATNVGCWTRPNTTFVYTKEKMAEWPWRLTSPKYSFQGIMNALAWSNTFCGERGTRGGLVGEGKGPWQRNTLIKNIFWIFWGIHCTTLPTMCLDHIIAHKTYYFYLALPLKPAPTCFIKQFVTFRAQEFKCNFFVLVYQLKCLKACNIPLERSWKYLNNGILYAQNILQSVVVKRKKIKIFSHLATAH